MQKPDVRQPEEGKEENGDSGDRAVYAAALWPLDQTEGVAFSVLLGFRISGFCLISV